MICAGLAAAFTACPEQPAGTTVRTWRAQVPAAAGARDLRRPNVGMLGAERAPVPFRRVN
jgi:hypothetical protein